jgi:hypothetical protein
MLSVLKLLFERKISSEAVLLVTDRAHVCVKNIDTIFIQLKLVAVTISNARCRLRNNSHTVKVQIKYYSNQNPQVITIHNTSQT